MVHVVNYEFDRHVQIVTALIGQVQARGLIQEKAVAIRRKWEVKPKELKFFKVTFPEGFPDPLYKTAHCLLHS